LREHPDGRPIAAFLRVRHPETPLLRTVDSTTAVAEVIGALGY
jgi:hypothetical protein